jgi:hypothetical protein
LCARSSVVQQSVNSLLHQDRPPDHIYVHSVCPDKMNNTSHGSPPNITRHPLVSVSETNACPDRGPGSKLLCTLEALAKNNKANNVHPEQAEEDRKRTVLILGDDDHVYWKGALGQMEQQFTKDWNNDNDRMPLTTAVTFHAYTQNRLRIGQGADLFALPLSQIQFETTLAFSECIIHHQPRLWFHDDAWISLMLRAQNISITTIKSIDSPWKRHVIYQKANAAVLGLYESKTKGLQRKELQELVREEWRHLARLCGHTVNAVDSKN